MVSKKENDSDPYKNISVIKPLAGVLCIVVALICAGALYESEFRWKQTDQSLYDSIASYYEEENTVVDVRILDSVEFQNSLLVFYKDTANDNVYGFMHYTKGINQKFRIKEYSRFSSLYSSMVASFSFQKGQNTYYAMGGYNLSDIPAYAIPMLDLNGNTVLLPCAVPQANFLDIYSEKDIQNMYNNQTGEAAGYGPAPRHYILMALLDYTGKDVTEQYSIGMSKKYGTSGGGGAASSEPYFLYIGMGLILIFGLRLAWHIMPAEQIKAFGGTKKKRSKATPRKATNREE